MREALLSSGRKAQSLADRRRNPEPSSRGSSRGTSRGDPPSRELATCTVAIFPTLNNGGNTSGTSLTPRSSSGNAFFGPGPRAIVSNPTDWAPAAETRIPHLPVGNELGDLFAAHLSLSPDREVESVCPPGKFVREQG